MIENVFVEAIEPNRFFVCNKVNFMPLFFLFLTQLCGYNTTSSVGRVTNYANFHVFDFELYARETKASQVCCEALYIILVVVIIFCLAL